MSQFPDTHPFLGTITRPTLIVDTPKAQANINRMATKARTADLHFRPHFKTIQSAKAAEWFRAEGVTKITVSSVKMAQYFAAHHWQDILIAFPANPREAQVLNALAQNIHLGLIADHPQTIQALAQVLHHPVDLWIEVDCGHRRTGIPTHYPEEIIALAHQIAQHPDKFRFQGILSHAGHSYQARGTKEIQTIHHDSLSRLQQVLTALRAQGFPQAKLSYGDTPTCSIATHFPDVHEIRPGNFVFYDLMQAQIGSCDTSQIALALACPVVAVHPRKNEVTIHGGAVHLSKDSIHYKTRDKTFGSIALPTAHGWQHFLPDTHIQSLSQEHGIIHCPDPFIHDIRIGDLLLVIPVHSCLTADCMQEWYDLDGNHYPMMS